MESVQPARYPGTVNTVTGDATTNSHGFTYGLFLFTDVEGSTRLWETAPDAMAAALERHDLILRAAVAGRRGQVFATGGDGFAASFARAGDAVAASLDIQMALAAERWPEGAALRVRMGIHTGAAQQRDGDYFGPTLNRAA